jgi:hypothetical protein
MRKSFRGAVVADRGLYRSAFDVGSCVDLNSQLLFGSQRMTTDSKLACFAQRLKRDPFGLDTVIEAFEADNAAIAVLHQDDFIASLLGDIFALRLAKPDSERAPCRVEVNIQLGHILSPSLIASVRYAVMRKSSSRPSGQSYFSASEFQRFSFFFDGIVGAVLAGMEN